MEFKLLSIERIRRGYAEHVPASTSAIYRLSFALRRHADPIKHVSDQGDTEILARFVLQKQAF